MLPKAPLADCAKCPLRDRPCVLPQPSPTPPKLAVIGEGPNVARPNLKVQDVYYTTAVLCKTASGRLGDKELDRAAKFCRKRLQKELADLPGGVPILALGANSAQAALRLAKRAAILPSKDQPGIRGSCNRVDGRLVFPTISPVTARKAPIWESVLEHDINRIYKYIGRTSYVYPEEVQGREIVTGDEAIAALDRLGSLVSLDVETTVAHPCEARLICVGFSDGRLSVVVPWSADLHGEEPWLPGPDMPLLVKALNRVLETRTVITHNGPNFDFIVLKRHGIHVKNWEDTLIGYHSISSHLRKALTHVVSMYLDTPAWKQEHAADRVGQGEGLEPMWRYNARDCLYTRLTWESMSRDLGMVDAVYRHDKVVATLCGELVQTGIAYDLPRARKFSQLLQQRETELQAQANQLARRPVNLLSLVDLKQLFFKELRAPVFFRTETGEAGLGVNAMQGYAALHDERISNLAQTILEYRRVRKIRSTYIESIQVGSDGRVHPNWLSYGAATGRWACREPNLQNLPRSSNDPCAAWGGIRSLYRSQPGKVLVGFDAKQLEMRVAAYWANDPNMIKACESTDIHSINTATVFGAGYLNASPAEKKRLRDIIKTTGFAALYGSSDVTIQANLASQQPPINMSVPEVGAVMGRIKKAFAGFYAAHEKLLDEVTRRGYMFSPILGRRRWLGHNPRGPEVLNSPCQMGAADLLNLKLPTIRDRLTKIGGAKLVAQVHDAGYTECLERDSNLVEEIYQEVFSEPVRIGKLEAVFPIDVKRGERWSEL